MSTVVTGLATQTEFPAITSLTPTGSTALGKDEFLKLLVAQLANQDPTNPQDSTAFVAQLAQFSSLEQQQNTVNRLDTLLLGQATANQTAASTFIGKNVTYQSGQIQLSQGSAPAVQMTLSAPADQVTVAVSDGSGNVVRTMKMGAAAAGDLAVTWDGTDNNGNVLPDGSYTIAPSAVDASGNPVPITLATAGTVSGVVFHGGVPYLQVGGGLISMSSVVSISAPPAASTPPSGSTAGSTASAMQAYNAASGASGAAP
jgi:flagellar basal-body rod modification protein FlgD